MGNAVQSGDLVLIDLATKGQPPFEAPVVTLAEPAILVLSLRFVLAAKRKHAIFQQHLDVVWIDAWYLRDQAEFVVNEGAPRSLGLPDWCRPTSASMRMRWGS